MRPDKDIDRVLENYYFETAPSLAGARSSVLAGLLAGFLLMVVCATVPQEPVPASTRTLGGVVAQVMEEGRE